MKKLSPAVVLLAIAAFLAPIIGGYVEENIQPLAPGGNPLLSLTSVEMATIAHAILGLLIVGSLLIPVLKKQVIQVPRGLVQVEHQREGDVGHGCPAASMARLASSVPYSVHLPWPQ